MMLFSFFLKPIKKSILKRRRKKKKGRKKKLKIGLSEYTAHRSGKYGCTIFCLLTCVVIVMERVFLVQIRATAFRETLCLEVPGTCP